MCWRVSMSAIISNDWLSGASRHHPGQLLQSSSFGNFCDFFKCFDLSDFFVPHQPLGYTHHQENPERSLDPRFRFLPIRIFESSSDISNKTLSCFYGSHESKDSDVSWDPPFTWLFTRFLVFYFYWNSVYRVKS